MARAKPKRLILLHGWTMNGASFAPLVKALTPALPDWQFGAPDLPGHGGAGEASLKGAAARLGEWMAEGEAVLLGWSMGALIAWDWLAEAAPEARAACKGVISLDMSPRPFPDWEFGMRGLTPAEAEARSPALARHWQASAGDMAGALFAARAPAPEPLAGHLAQRIAGLDPQVMVPFWDEMLRTDLRDTLPALDLPALALHGAASKLYPSGTAEWVAKALPQGRAHVIPEAGHAPHLQAPEATARLIADFCKELA